MLSPTTTPNTFYRPQTEEIRQLGSSTFRDYQISDQNKSSIKRFIFDLLKQSENRKTKFEAREDTIFSARYVFVEKDELRELEGGVIYVNKDQIDEFISRHKEINSYMETIVAIVRKYFASEQLQLELISEEGLDNQRGTLFLSIITDLNPREALSVLKILDKVIFEETNIDSNLINLDLMFK